MSSQNQGISRNLIGFLKVSGTVRLLKRLCHFLEMLQFRKQKSLAAQAMHELGNIMFHSGNIRFVNSILSPIPTLIKKKKKMKL